MLRLNPTLKWRWEGKDKVLLNTLVGMNRTAGEVLELCQRAGSVDDVIERMQGRYPQVAAAKLQADIAALIDRFRTWNVLVADDGPDVPPLHVPRTATHVRHIATFFHNELTAPVMVLAEVTMACDLHCPHCAVTATRTPSPLELTTDEWKRYIDELAALHVFTLTFTGGEPLLRPDLEELIGYATACGLKTTIDTNGQQLSRARLAALVAAGLKGLQLSLDGATAETHDRFRGCQGLHAHVLHMVPLIVESGITFQIATMLTRRNMHEIIDIVELVAGLGVERFVLMRLLHAGRGAMYTALKPSEDEMLAWLPRFHQKAQQRPRPFIFYPPLPAAYYERSIGLDAYLQLKNDGHIGSCAAGITTCVMSATGDIRPCDVSEDVSLGNVREWRFQEVWQDSPVFRHLRRITKEAQVPCRACRLRGVCAAGCQALPTQIGRNGNLHEADVACLKCFQTFGADLRETA